MKTPSAEPPGSAIVAVAAPLAGAGGVVVVGPDAGVEQAVTKRTGIRRPRVMPGPYGSEHENAMKARQLRRNAPRPALR